MLCHYSRVDSPLAYLDQSQVNQVTAKKTAVYEFQRLQLSSLTAPTLGH